MQIEQKISLLTMAWQLNSNWAIHLTLLLIRKLHHPGDFATKVKQINSQSDLIWMSRFSGPTYLTIRSSVYIILI